MDINRIVRADKKYENDPSLELKIVTIFLEKSTILPYFAES